MDLEESGAGFTQILETNQALQVELPAEVHSKQLNSELKAWLITMEFDHWHKIDCDEIFSLIM